MDLRSIASLSFACLALAGCALMLPDALRENETVTIESSMPAAESRVPAGTRIEIRVKYRIDPFVPGQKYYLIACNLDNCRSRPEYAKEITTAKGRETIAFPLHSEGGYVAVTREEPRIRPACPSRSVCWDGPNALETEPIIVRIDPGP